jgi:predicted GNAT family acetyltransferase
MATEVRNVPEESRYEVLEDGRVVGIAEYVDRGEVLVFHHTEIDAPLRGHGLGAHLVRAALDDVRARGRTIIATCWYVAGFVDAHCEYHNLLAPDVG